MNISGREGGDEYAKRKALGVWGGIGTDCAASGPGGSRAGCGAFRIEQRDGKMEPGADADFAFDPYSSAVHFNEMLGDCQAEASAAGFARAGRVHSIEALEDARLVGSGNADASVGNSEHHGMIFQHGA